MRDINTSIFDGREVRYIGVNYDPEIRTINDVKVEEVLSKTNQ